MAEIQRRNLYQPQNVSQGFNPVKAADITPFLRENQRRQERGMERQQRAAMQDLRTEQKNIDLEAIEANRDLNALMAFAPTIQGQLQEFAKNRIAESKANATQWAAAQDEKRAEIVAKQSALKRELRAQGLEESQITQELAKLDVHPQMIDEANKSNSWDQYWRCLLYTSPSPRDA